MVLLIILVLLVPSIIQIFDKETQWDHTAFIKQTDKIIQSSKAIEESKGKANSKTILFNFNPNTVKYKQLIQLGFSEKQAHTLINYRKAGGTFKQKSDIKKVYGISEAFYKKIKPYILLENENAAGEKEFQETENDFNPETVDSSFLKDEKYYNKTLNLTIELNSATLDDLILLPGIGKTYGQRILDYRKLLGGFYNEQQLLEVYGLSDSLLANITSYLEIDTIKIQKINLNSVEFKALNRHPYVDYILTKKIFNYKSLMDSISDPKELLNNHLIDSMTYQRLSPYFTVK